MKNYSLWKNPGTLLTAWTLVIAASYMQSWSSSKDLVTTVASIPDTIHAVLKGDSKKLQESATQKMQKDHPDKPIIKFYPPLWKDDKTIWFETAGNLLWYYRKETNTVDISPVQSHCCILPQGTIWGILWSTPQ